MDAFVSDRKVAVSLSKSREARKVFMAGLPIIRSNGTYLTVMKERK